MRVLVTGGSGFIGTNLVGSLRADRVPALNLDKAPPLCQDHASLWHRCDILDGDRLKEAFARFRPSQVVHLAARVDCDEEHSLQAYRDNIEGMTNVLLAVRATPGVERLIVTSSFFVCRPGYQPKSDRDYAPHTRYGESKVVTEELTRAADLSCTWTIVRPTAIWGPWLIRHREQIFRLLQKGWYVHPAGGPVIRSWGYVGNVVQQLRRLLVLPPEQVDEKIFYLGDEILDLADWVNAWSRRLRGCEVRTAPRWLIRAFATLGDAVERAGGRPLITTRRYRAMTENHLAPMDGTFAVLGRPRYTLQEGIDKTMRWLHECDEHGRGRHPQPRFAPEFSDVSRTSVTTGGTEGLT